MKKFMQEHKEIVQGIGIGIGILLVLIILFVVSENTGDRTGDKTGSSQTTSTTEEANPLLEDGQVLDEEKMKSVEEITIEDFKSYLKKKTTTVVMLGYDDCYWCQQQKPILESVMYEYDLDVKYLKVDKEHLSEEDYDYLTGLHEDLEGFGTPTFLAIRSKKVREVSPNAKNRTQLIKMFADMGMLKSE